ncbi:hypothetical protein T484DRAFT_2111294 [Baffinella frigidus]|nr:hypothetical protein T484DRAFT_2111294 [Cryptophyta sp. CCMP2293]
MRYVLTFAACAAFLHSSSAFAPSALPIRSAPALALRTAAPIAARLPRTRLAAAVRLAMVTKESPLEAGGLRGIEEEERRVTLWTNHFDLSTEQVASLRNEFEAFLKKESCELRNVGYASLKKIVEAANADIDLADVDDGELAEGGRPRVTEEELNNYVKALGPLWADT